MKENMVNRPLIILVGLIAIFMIAMMFIGCESSKQEEIALETKIKAPKEKPDVVGRLGWSWQQICSWENGDANWVQEEYKSDKLTMHHISTKDVKVIYDFNDSGYCIMTTMMTIARNSADATLYVEDIQVVAKDLGFRVNEPLAKEKGSDVLIGTFKYLYDPGITGLLMVVRVGKVIKIGFSVFKETKNT